MTDLRAAIAALRRGEAACFPTETVWSLSCFAFDDEAVDGLRVLKKRPPTMPLAVGFHSWRAVYAFAEPNELAEAMAKAFLPGPVSLVVPRRGDDLAHVAPGLGSVSIRIPDHPIARDILDVAGALVMTSANEHGQPDPLSAAQVRQMVPGVEVVDAPDVPGTASTVVDCTGDEPRILREGLISRQEVLAAWR